MAKASKVVVVKLAVSLNKLRVVSHARSSIKEELQLQMGHREVELSTLAAAPTATSMRTRSGLSHLRLQLHLTIRHLISPRILSRLILGSLCSSKRESCLRSSSSSKLSLVVATGNRVTNLKMARSSTLRDTSRWLQLLLLRTASSLPEVLLHPLKKDSRLLLQPDLLTKQLLIVVA